MKKQLYFLFALCLLLILSACGKEETTKATTKTVKPPVGNKTTTESPELFSYENGQFYFQKPDGTKILGKKMTIGASNQQMIEELGKPETTQNDDSGYTDKWDSYPVQYLHNAQDQTKVPDDLMIAYKKNKAVTIYMRDYGAPFLPAGLLDTFDGKIVKSPKSGAENITDTYFFIKGQAYFIFQIKLDENKNISNNYGIYQLGSADGDQSFLNSDEVKKISLSQMKKEIAADIQAYKENRITVSKSDPIDSKEALVQKLSSLKMKYQGKAVSFQNWEVDTDSSGELTVLNQSIPESSLKEVDSIHAAGGTGAVQRWGEEVMDTVKEYAQSQNTDSWYIDVEGACQAYEPTSFPDVDLSGFQVPAGTPSLLFLPQVMDHYPYFMVNSEWGSDPTDTVLCFNA